MNQIILITKKKITDLKIQGASEVAKSLVFALKEYAKKEKFRDFDEFYKRIQKSAKELAYARPTEPLAQNVVKFLVGQIREKKNLEKTRKEFIKACDRILEVLEKNHKKIAQNISKIIENGDKVFTHCHSSTVEEGLILAKKKEKKFEVFNTETRPLFQGRITAKNLTKAGIKTTMIVDSSASFLISRFSGKDLMMTKVLIGCDAILPDGSIINKIGSFGIALSAHYEKIPLYVAGFLLKFTPNSWIKIEKRSPKEIWKKAPKGLKIINFAFDTVPSYFIKGIICEKGIIRPKETKKIIKKIYPWILKNSHI